MIKTLENQEPRIKTHIGLLIMLTTKNIEPDKTPAPSIQKTINKNLAKHANISDKVIAKAFYKCNYNLANTAKALNLGRNTFRNLIESRPGVKELLAEQQLAVIEKVEDGLHKKIEEGDLKAIMFFLERRHPAYKKQVQVNTTIQTITREVTSEMSQEEAAKAYFDTLRQLNPA